MKQTGYSGGLAMFVVVPVAGITEGIVPGMKTTWAATPDDAASEADRYRAIEEYPLSNARLLAYAARNPPPQSWCEEVDDLF